MCVCVCVFLFTCVLWPLNSAPLGKSKWQVSDNSALENTQSENRGGGILEEYVIKMVVRPADEPFMPHSREHRICYKLLIKQPWNRKRTSLPESMPVWLVAAAWDAVMRNTFSGATFSPVGKSV